jgi:hypothetical protein
VGGSNCSWIVTVAEFRGLWELPIGSQYCSLHIEKQNCIKSISELRVPDQHLSHVLTELQVRLLELSQLQVRLFEPSQLQVRLLEPSQLQVRLLEPSQLQVRLLELSQLQ